MATWDHIEWNNSKVFYCSVQEHHIQVESTTSSSSSSTAEPFRIDTEYDFQDHTGFVLWRPCAITLSRLLLANPNIVRNKRIIELGAGIALPSAVAAYLLREQDINQSTSTCNSFILATDAMRPTLRLANINIEYNLRSTENSSIPPSLEQFENIGKENDNIFPHSIRLRWGKKQEMKTITDTYKSFLFRSHTDYGFDLFLASDVLWLRPYVEENIYYQAKQLLRTVYYLMTKTRRIDNNSPLPATNDGTKPPLTNQYIASTTNPGTPPPTTNITGDTHDQWIGEKQRRINKEFCVWKVPSRKRYNLQKKPTYLIKILEQETTNTSSISLSSLSRVSSLSSFPSSTTTTADSSLTSSPLTIPYIHDPVSFGDTALVLPVVASSTPTPTTASSLVSTPSFVPSSLYCPLLILSYQCRLDGMTQDIMNAAERTGFDMGIVSTASYRTVMEQQNEQFPLVHIVILSPCTNCLDRFIKDNHLIRLNPIRVSMHDQHYRDRSGSSNVHRDIYGLNSTYNMNDSSSTEGEYSSSSTSSDESTNDHRPSDGLNSANPQKIKHPKVLKRKKKNILLPNCHHTNPLFRNKK